MSESTPHASADPRVASPADALPEPAAGRRARGLVLRIGFTLAALGAWYALAGDSLDELGPAFRALSVPALVGAWLITLVNLFVGTFRWRVLLQAYGAVNVPGFLTLARLYYVGYFFNTFFPANVGGDLLRATVTRRAFPGRTGAYLIVLVERVFGLGGLITLAGVMLALRPISAELPNQPWLGVLGVLAALGAISGPILARRLAPYLPGPLGRLAADLPAVRHFAPLVGVFALSLVTQSLVALTGHVLIASLDPQVALSASLVIIPVAIASMYLPSIAGIGVRETAFVALFALVHVPEAHATAASLAFLGVTLAGALVGGLVLLIGGMPALDDGSESTPDTLSDAALSDAAPSGAALPDTPLSGAHQLERRAPTETAPTTPEAYDD